MSARIKRQDDQLFQLNMEQRYLRTRFENQLPHLATKADLKDTVSRAMPWIAGALGALFALALMLVGLQKQEISALRAEFASDRTELRKEAQELRKELHAVRADTYRKDDQERRSR